jgi:hypothetical protein
MGSDLIVMGSQVAGDSLQAYGEARDFGRLREPSHPVDQLAARVRAHGHPVRLVVGIE